MSVVQVRICAPGANLSVPQEAVHELAALEDFPTQLKLVEDALALGFQHLLFVCVAVLVKVRRFRFGQA